VRMSDQVTTGSSLMPQKKNPDALELLRGKAGRIVAQPMALSVTLKGLPLAYNKDMQEDKEPLFESMAQLSMCLQVLGLVLDGLALNKDVAKEAAERGYTNATDLADYLVEKGIAFRDAHEIVGRIVNHAVEEGVAIEELSIEKLRGLDDRIGDDVYGWLTIEAVLSRRDVLGGTAPERVQLAVAEARSRIEHTQVETVGTH
ncbi:MAG: lyase family protein, partial [Planctomycetota bacterium]